MTDEEVLAEVRAAGALLEGHFILSSGLHSARYLQCARVLMDARRAGRLAAALAEAGARPKAARKAASLRRDCIDTPVEPRRQRQYSGARAARRGAL